MPLARLRLLPLLLLLAGCGTEPTDSLAPGHWGGEAILSVGGDSSSLIAGCFSAMLPGTIPLDGAGQFSLPATIVVQAPVARSEPGRVEGILHGSRLSISLLLDQDAQSIGPYQLRRGAPVPVDGCLLR